MALINKLQTGGSVLSKLNGKNASIPRFKESQLHFQYSINREPNFLKRLPPPSQLDLNGEVPSTNYRDNAPENQGGRV